MTERVVGATPVLGSERIVALDVLRGFAVLGILAMNIQSFAMVGSAYLNPSSFGDLNGINFVVFAAGRFLADLKFMGVFSLLFGAGIVLFATRAEAAGRRPGPLHYRRMIWLWIIGLMHGYLLWYGDILVTYATCGALAYLMHRCRLRTLVIVGLTMFVVPTLTYGATGLYLPQMAPEPRAELLGFWAPNAEAIASHLAAFRGGWLDQMPLRVNETASMQLTVFWIYFGWRVSGLMLLGMALFKTGVLTGERSDGFYRRLIGIGLVAGLPLIAWGLVNDIRTGWTQAGSMFLGHLWNYWGSVGVIAAYIGLIMLVVRRGAMPGLQARLAAVGRMAFSNYLGQTLICTTVFYGHGFGLYGHLERWQQALVVLAVWALQLWLSPWWLARFRFGPAEWVWRSLTYWRVQPIRRIT